MRQFGDHAWSLGAPVCGLLTVSQYCDVPWTDDTGLIEHSILNCGSPGVYLDSLGLTIVPTVAQGSVVADVDFKKGTYKFGLGMKFEIPFQPQQQAQQQ